MRRWSLLCLVPAVAIGIAGAADQDRVPLFTNEDLDRMFGPAPAQPRDQVDKTHPEDWRWVQEFLDREYSRIDADRQFELNDREIEISAAPVNVPARIYGGSSIWGGGYPAFAWWNAATVRYSGSLNRRDRTPCLASRKPFARTPGGVDRPDGRWGMPHGGHSNRSGTRSK